VKDVNAWFVRRAAATRFVLLEGANSCFIRQNASVRSLVRQATSRTCPKSDRYLDL